MKLRFLPNSYSILQFSNLNELNHLDFTDGDLLSVTKNQDELSVVVESEKAIAISRQVKLKNINQDWVAFKVEGTLDFSLTGILLSIAQPLATEKISLFAVSTFDTDIILIKSDSREKAETALKANGFSFVSN